MRVVIPDKKAATYLSFIGFTDTRMELDSNIKYGNHMYYPALSIMACKAAYNNAAYNQALIEGQWKVCMTVVSFYLLLFIKEIRLIFIIGLTVCFVCV